MSDAIIRNDIDLDIAAERRRQDDKWGQQNHDATVWLAVLTEEVGELADAALVRRALLADGYSIGPAIEQMRHEAVQVAAVAVAFIEWMDRGCPVHEDAAGETAAVEIAHHEQRDRRSPGER